MKTDNNFIQSKIIRESFQKAMSFTSCGIYIYIERDDHLKDSRENL